jgi:hypothetical protein
VLKSALQAALGHFDPVTRMILSVFCPFYYFYPLLFVITFSLINGGEHAMKYQGILGKCGEKDTIKCQGVTGI